MFVYDKQGNEYSLSQEECADLVASGAYFLQNPQIHKEAIMNMESNGLVAVYDKKTGESFYRRPVDARELVKTGKYSFDGKAEKAQETEKKIELQRGEDGLPVLTQDSTKQEIIAALSEYGVQYRNDMNKAALLDLWKDFLVERAG